VKRRPESLRTEVALLRQFPVKRIDVRYFRLFKPSYKILSIIPIWSRFGPLSAQTVIYVTATYRTVISDNYGGVLKFQYKHQ